jgi:hypothetical protein
MQQKVPKIKADNRPFKVLLYLDEYRVSRALSRLGDETTNSTAVATAGTSFCLLHQKSPPARWLSLLRDQAR